MKDFLGDAAFPDDRWRPAAPEEVGLDAGRLHDGLAAMEARRLPLHALLLVRRGRLVVERYGVAGEEAGRQLCPDDLRHVQSSGKTMVTSMLVGRALVEGVLPALDAPIAPWFPGLLRDGKERITLADLLTMRSGLTYREGNEAALWASPSVAEAYPARPLAAEPGTRWNYSSADSQVLAEILRRATGDSPLAYARPRLFAPLGIERFHWYADASGTNIGGGGLLLRPRDLARFGWMLACGGRWEDGQVVPAEWIARATRPWVTDHGHPSGAYGLHVWCAPPAGFGGFVTRGYRGQNVYVLPERELVVVFTAELPFPECDGILDGVMAQHLLPAVQG